MISSPLIAILYAIAISCIFYVSCLAIIFPIIKERRHLLNRWKQVGRKLDQEDKIQDINFERRLKTFQRQSRVKEFLANPFPTFRMIENLLYRSNTLPHLKSHIAYQGVGTAILFNFFLIYFRFSLINSLLLGVSISLFFHLIFLKSKESHWKKSFIRIFPLSLDIINRGLRSGLTLGRGIAMVSEEIEDPVGSEFNYMASQLQIGVTPDKALFEAAERIGIDEFRFFSLALIIQREMGGSLADILEKLSELIRERDRFQRKVWTLSSESRTTALIVGALPIFLGIMVELVSPGYINFFFTDPKGKIMLMVCLGLSVSGAAVITRLMKVEN